MNRKIFALMDKDVIQDFLVAYNIDNAIHTARNLYVDGDAIDCTIFDCNVGDFYKNGSFYRRLENGSIIEILPTYCTSGYESKIIRSLENAKNRIEFLEKIICENGLDELIK